MVSRSYVPSDPDYEFKAWRKNIEDRLLRMETENRLNNASMKNGSLVSYDADLNKIIELGKSRCFIPGKGEDKECVIFTINNSSGRNFLFIDTEEGWISPKFNNQFIKSNDYEAVSSDTYYLCYRSDIPILGNALFCEVVVTADSATTGNVRLVLGSRVTSSIPISGPTQMKMRFAWDISSLYKVDSNAILRVEAQRVSGSGFINVYSPERCYTIAKSQLSSATMSGVADES